MKIVKRILLGTLGIVVGLGVFLAGSVAVDFIMGRERINTVTNTTNEEEAVETIEIYAGPWVGAISGQDENGQPTSDSCTVCHNDTIAGDQFTPWAATGHAEINLP